MALAFLSLLTMHRTVNSGVNKRRQLIFNMCDILSSLWVILIQIGTPYLRNAFYTGT